MSFHYQLTRELETGNQLIDNQHRQLFEAVNRLLEACSQGHGRDQMMSTVKFLENYVAKHFGDEESLQIRYHYPNYAAHRQFHEKYKKDLSALAGQIMENGADMGAIVKLNQEVAVLIAHIRIEDKRLAECIRNA